MKHMDLEAKKTEDYEIIGRKSDEEQKGEEKRQISIDKIKKLRLVIKLIVDETMAEYTNIFCDEVRRIVRENEREQKEEMLDLVSDISKKNKRELQEIIAKEMDYQFRHWQEEQDVPVFSSDKKKRLM